MIKFDDGVNPKEKLSIASAVSKIEALYTVYLMSVNKNTNELLEVQESKKIKGLLVQKQTPLEE